MPSASCVAAFTKATRENARFQRKRDALRDSRGRARAARLSQRLDSQPALWLGRRGPPRETTANSAVSSAALNNRHTVYILRRLERDIPIARARCKHAQMSLRLVLHGLFNSIPELAESVTSLIQRLTKLEFFTACFSIRLEFFTTRFILPKMCEAPFR
jgi:hypothetical protein